jgi:predicted transcriptional regulator
MVNRDRYDIVVEILEKAKSSKNKTEIIRDVGLSYLQTKQYLGTLIEKGLLEIDANQRFKTTKKGLEFLEKCADCLLFKWPKTK